MTCAIVRILHCNIAMKIHEYQAKALLARYGVPVPRGEVALSVKEAGAACQIASELEQPRVVWSNPAFEHNAALIVTGKWPATRNNGEQAYMLCLFDKQTAKVEIQEIEAPLFK